MGTFRWHSGQVSVPAGLYYRDAFGADWFMGQFHGSGSEPLPISQSDENLVIEHDIDLYAGAWAQRDQALFFEERRVQGVPVWIAVRRWGPESSPNKLAMVTFPDNDCANFYMKSWDRSGLDVVRKIAKVSALRKPAKLQIPVRKTVTSYD